MTVFEQHNAIDIALNLDLYAMYLRKSRADIELEAISKEETLARHKAMLYALAERMGILPNQIVVYHEIVSGDSLDSRPEALRLLADVHARKYKGVFVTEVERLARGNTKDQGEVAEAFSLSGTLIITPAKVYNPAIETDEEYFEFGLFMSRREFKTLNRRMNTGKLQSVQEGNYLPPVPPYGFDVVRKSKRNRYLVEKPEESRIVKMIFNWYTEDRKPTSWIAKQLTLMNIPTRNKGKEWARATIKDILFNAHYIGKVTWGEQQTIKEKDPATGKVVKRRRNSGNIQYYEGKHKGFISEEQFWKVRTIYGSQAPAKVNTELVNPLSGILVCARCGRAIRFQSYPDNRISRYHHPYGVHMCKMKTLFAPVVIDALIKALNACVEDFQIKVDTGEANAEADRQKAAIEAMEAELAKQERMKRRLFESWEADDGTYTKEEFLERKQMYAQTIDSLKAQIEEAQKNTPAPVDYEERITNIHAIIESLNDPDIAAKEKNDFLKQFIEKIEFDAIDFGKGRGGAPVLDVYFK